jgi:murein DD-endopeptidase MepM/ murein hydrolase activator NlpD
MDRKRKTRLIVGLSIIVIVGGFGGFVLYKFIPAHWNTNRVVIGFPFADTQYIDAVQGYGEMTWGDFHNGIDIGVNHSTELIAWCDLRITGLKTWFNEGGGHWQTNIGASYNWKYRFDVAVESWALNETYGNLQRDALTIKVGQIVKQGDSLGFLLSFGCCAHIHFGIKESGTNVCPYQFMTPYAQSLVDHFFALYGSGGTICGE